jgi:hypothetical protein
LRHGGNPAIFSDQKKLSIAALSQTLPERFMLQTRYDGPSAVENSPSKDDTESQPSPVQKSATEVYCGFCRFKDNRLEHLSEKPRCGAL